MIKDIIDKAQTEKKKVLIYAHKNPDADAISSEHSLVKYLKQFGVEAIYVVGKTINPNLRQISNLNPKNTISIIVDTSNLDYAENTKFLKANKNDIYVYDHHVNENNNVIEYELGLPAKNVLRDSEQSSNCEVLLNDFDIKKISPEIANYLLEGVIGDTAKLLYIKQNTIKNIITLMKCGADFQKCYDYISKRKEIQSEKGMGYAFLNTKKIDLGDTFGTMLCVDNQEAKMLEQQFLLKNMQKSVTRMQHIIGCSFNCVIAENEEGEFDVDLRSLAECKNFDVQKIATKFGGGGHHNASGCHFSSKDGFDLQKVENLIINEIKQMAKENLNVSTKIAFNEKDKELSEIFTTTNKLQSNVDIEKLAKIQKLIDEGAHYAPLIAEYKTYEQFMINNELSCLIPNQNPKLKNTELEIVIPSEIYNDLNKKYNLTPDKIEKFENSLNFAKIKSCKIILPEEKNLEK